MKLYNKIILNKKFKIGENRIIRFHIYRINEHYNFRFFYSNKKYDYDIGLVTKGTY